MAELTRERVIGSFGDLIDGARESGTVILSIELADIIYSTLRAFDNALRVLDKADSTGSVDAVSYWLAIKDRLGPSPEGTYVLIQSNSEQQATTRCKPETVSDTARVPAVSGPQSPPQANRPGSQSACAGTGAETGPAVGDLVARLRNDAEIWIDCKTIAGNRTAALEREVADALERLVRERDECRKWHEGARMVAKLLTERAEGAELRAEVAERERDDSLVINLNMATALATVGQRAEAAERDAERYRWARPILSGDDGNLVDRRALELAMALTRGIDVDAAIDEAMKK